MARAKEGREKGGRNAWNKSSKMQLLRELFGLWGGIFVAEMEKFFIFASLIL